ncbi:unnamed protein product [Candida verbasci]|uniref:peptidylprolyl isomerase n=1 Tax=Candida verbasci TaxID=1227364 RepID=A0A9W4XLR0_9ASCO|nr:unnamed protein product [Candida verbasci]
MLINLLLYITLVISAVVPVNKLTFTEDEKKLLERDPVVTHKITFTISENDQVIGDLKLALFGEVVPTTVENFFQLSSMAQGYGYLNSKFHRIIKNFMIQGGNYDDLGGKSIYGDRFNDENFQVKHDKLGRLSMANAGVNTNGAQFFILNSDKQPHLDGKHVVFGQLINGFDTLEKISNAETDGNHKPVKDIIISDIKTVVFDKGLEQQETPTTQLHYDEVIKDITSIYSYLFVLLLVKNFNTMFPIVQVKNLPFNSSSKSLYEFFGKFGNINQIRINEGSCFIIYTNFINAEKAAKVLNGVNFNGRYLITSLYQVDKSKLDDMKLRKEQLESLQSII